MNSMLLDEKVVAPWISSALPVIRIVLFCLVVLGAIILILTTLFQNEDANSADVVTGKQESYYSQNKGGSRDSKLKLITIITAIVVVVCVVLYLVSLLIKG